MLEVLEVIGSELGTDLKIVREDMERGDARDTGADISAARAISATSPSGKSSEVPGTGRLASGARLRTHSTGCSPGTSTR